MIEAFDKQSPNIAMGVDAKNDDPDSQGAGDQGLMFGYVQRNRVINATTNQFGS